MSRKPFSHQNTKEYYEQRFNCVVCMCPHLRMVSGMCQHRICITCLYGDGVYLRESFLKCPVCQYHCSFPCTKPEIPEDNMDMMRCLGVRACQNGGCDVELWEWEMEDHLKSCARKPASPKPEALTPRSKKKRRSDDSDIPKKVTRQQSMKKTKSRTYSFRAKSTSK